MNDERRRDSKDLHARHGALTLNDEPRREPILLLATRLKGEEAGGRELQRPVHGVVLAERQVDRRRQNRGRIQDQVYPKLCLTLVCLSPSNKNPRFYSLFADVSSRIGFGISIALFGVLFVAVVGLVIDSIFFSPRLWLSNGC